jgi:hypothetical protein
MINTQKICAINVVGFDRKVVSKKLRWKECSVVPYTRGVLRGAFTF